MTSAQVLLVEDQECLVIPLDSSLTMRDLTEWAAEHNVALATAIRELLHRAVLA